LRRGSTLTTIKPELLDELLAGVSSPDDLMGDAGLFRELKKALMGRALGAELTHHLGYERGDPAGRGSGNSRNGHSTKRVLSDDGELDLAIPRDRAKLARGHAKRSLVGWTAEGGTFEPQLVPKGQTRLDGFDGKVISLYARGLTVREMQGHLQELYGVEVSPDLISRVTDAVLEEVREWQNRPLDPVYPVVFFDALRVKIRDEGLVKNKAVYVALALDAEGQKHVLGLWIEQSEGAKFWLKVMNELKTRGVGDILIAVIDGLKGFPEPIGAAFPETIVQTCIVHLIRSSLAFVSWKDRKIIMPDLKAIYRAETAEAALDRLGDFEEKWGARYPAIGQAWRRAWEHVVPLFAFPPAIRKMIYTTNAVESLHRSLRKIIKTRGSFPTDEAATKLLYLAIQNAGVHWRRPVEWTAAMGQFAILFGDRFAVSAR
jgi:putative transposase